MLFSALFIQSIESNDTDNRISLSFPLYLGAAMTAFPPKYIVHNASEFESIQLPPPEDNTLGLTVMARVNPDGRLFCLKCNISGMGRNKYKVKATKILASPPLFISKLFFVFSASAEEMTPPNNATSTIWKDLTASIKDGTVLVTNGNGKEGGCERVLAYLDSQAAQKIPGGSSTRWAVAATASTSPTTLQMELQVLPAPAKSLLKPNLKADNCVSVQVVTIPLRTELFDGAMVAGPVPTLFATDCSAAITSLMDNAAGTLGDLLELNSNFYIMDHVSMEDAVVYLKGHARKAKGILAFPPPVAKKIKITRNMPAALRSETGRIRKSYLIHLLSLAYTVCSKQKPYIPRYS